MISPKDGDYSAKSEKKRTVEFIVRFGQRRALFRLPTECFEQDFECTLGIEFKWWPLRVDDQLTWFPERAQTSFQVVSKARLQTERLRGDTFIPLRAEVTFLDYESRRVRTGSYMRFYEV